MIRAAIEVHRELGPGLLECIYEECLCRELDGRSVPYARQVPLSLQYKGCPVRLSYRMDLVVAGEVVIEVKAVEEVLPVHRAQLLSYLRLSGMRLGLLLNFHVPVLKAGITRLAL